MEKTVIAYYNSRDDAERSVRHLREKGFGDNEISILAKDEQQSSSQGEEMSFQNQNLTDGTMTGGALGGLAGLAMGAGALLIPGLGPIVAAGPLAGVLTGALTGGVAGGLIDYGIPEESSRRYEQHLESGKVLAIIKTEAGKAMEAMKIMDRTGGRGIEMH
ncbi:MAG: hypothetical protein PHS56_02005 [Eubacteriales bacterium]|nr:hypothetical protein [Eubacteriales bacterium]MDD3073190.1 hypothetical protein [Eubacteriales bacterium]MDD4078396.1 hypothetical protein [Eubacteriales bacterium]MDD4768639.1 hypothetical protein [Eubacteriales bacterium]